MSVCDSASTKPCRREFDIGLKIKSARTSRRILEISGTQYFTGNRSAQTNVERRQPQAIPTSRDATQCIDCPLAVELGSFSASSVAKILRRKSTEMTEATCISAHLTRRDCNQLSRVVDISTWRSFPFGRVGFAHQLWLEQLPINLSRESHRVDINPR